MIHVMPSDGGLSILAKWRENFAKFIKLSSSFANLLEAIFMILTKILKCQLKTYRWSQKNFIHPIESLDTCMEH